MHIITRYQEKKITKQKQNNNDIIWTDKAFIRTDMVGMLELSHWELNNYD